MTVSVRQADISDLGEVERLDAICFQPSDPDHQPAAPGELRAGLQARQCLVAELNDVVVGYIAHDAPSPDHIYISALAVEPGHRESGVGGALLDHFLRSLSPTTLVTTSISTVTSPNNLPMLRLLCSRNFIVRRQLADYFEPGSKRFYCQLKTRHMFTDPDDRYLVPVGSIASIGHLLDDDAYVITDVLSMSWDAFVYEISRFDVDDIGSLQSDECAASISFQSAILAILTFLLGFAFASSNYPAGARAVLVFATLASTISLIIYANASGDLSRLQNGDFQQYMKWGNLLSEFGGVQPFAVVLALTFANVASTDATGAVVAGGVGVVRAGEERVEAARERQRVRLSGTNLRANADMGAADENLRHGAPPARPPGHGDAQGRVARHVDLDKADALAGEQPLGGNAIGTDCGGVHLDGGHRRGLWLLVDGCWLPNFRYGFVYN